MNRSITALLLCIPIAACSSAIQLGPSDDGSVDAGALREDAGVSDGASDAMTDPVPPAELCGFRFEHEAPPNYTHVWGTSPTDIWLVENRRDVFHWNGSRLTATPFPESPGYREVRRIEGSSTPWIETEADDSFLVWNGSSWGEVPIPGGLLDPELVVMGSDNAWILGTPGFPSPWLLYHYDGSDWSLIDGPLDGHSYLSRFNNTEILLQTISEDTGVHHFLKGDADGLSPVEPPAGHANTELRHLTGDGDSELWIDTFGGVWTGEEWWGEWRTSSWSVRTAGFYDGAFWLIRQDGALVIEDVTNPSAAATIAPPAETEILRSVLPASGPPFVVGAGVHYWDGTAWGALFPSTPPLFQSFSGASGQSEVDYWIWGSSVTGAAVRLSDGIIERVLAPSDCAYRGVENVHALSGGAYVARTCRGLERYRDGVFTDVMISNTDPGASVAFWGSVDTGLYAFMDNSVFRFDGEDFQLEREGIFDDAPSFFGPRLLAGDSSGVVYLYGDDPFDGPVPDALLRRKDGVWDWTPPAPLGELEFQSMYVEPSGRVWLAGAGSGDETRVWSLTGDVWSVESIPTTADIVATADIRLNEGARRYLGGRGEDVWLVSNDRAIWRRSPAGEWVRDERCAESEALRNIRFQGIWFPPEGPPKIFGSGGNVLVYAENLD